MKINLKKKSILITGGTGALGKKICECLAKNGANLIILDRKNPKNFVKVWRENIQLKHLLLKLIS